MMPESFGRHRILVVGDVMLDRYWEGATRRISPEAPVPVVRISETGDRPGGAANVAVNLAALGLPVTLLGWVGEDEAGAILAERLRDAGVDARLIAAGRCTIVKLRVMSLRQQVIRLDFEHDEPPLDADALARAFDEVAAGHELVVFSDYGKGTLADVSGLIARCRALGIPAIVDPKGRDFSRYCGAHVVTPNESEFFEIVGQPADEADFAARAEALRDAAGIHALLVTRGPRGMSLFERGCGVRDFPAQTLDVYDVTGAGDTAIATLAAGLAAHVPMVDCVRLANRAAGIVVGRRGSASITRADLFEDADPLSGLASEDHVLHEIAQARRRGEKIVMTNGCFDILHPGHIEYLRGAKSLGHRLLVAVNSDASVARLKGRGRPVNPLASRMAMLASLRAVDWVIPFDGSVDAGGRRHDTPLDLIRRVRPDVLVKGGDYRMDEIVGAADVLAWGGEVRILPLVAGQSTTGVIARIAERRG